MPLAATQMTTSPAARPALRRSATACSASSSVAPLWSSSVATPPAKSTGVCAAGMPKVAAISIASASAISPELPAPA